MQCVFFWDFPRRLRFKSLLHSPAYEDGTESSETSASKTHTPGKIPKENILHPVKMIPSDTARENIGMILDKVHHLPAKRTKTFHVSCTPTACKYSRTPIIRKLAIQNANYPDRPGL